MLAEVVGAILFFGLIIVPVVVIAVNRVRSTRQSYVRREQPVVSPPKSHNNNIDERDAHWNDLPQSEMSQFDAEEVYINTQLELASKANDTDGYIVYVLRDIPESITYPEVLFLQISKLAPKYGLELITINKSKLHLRRTT